MLRVRVTIAGLMASTVAMLGGCSGANMPAWLQIKPPKQSLRFESDPSGAEVRTPDGQVCRTPCSLSLPLTAQSANFTLEGYLPQSVPVQIHQSTVRLDDNSFPPPDFEPNPVEATLQAVEKPSAKSQPIKQNNATVIKRRKKPPPPAVTSEAPTTVPGTIIPMALPR